MTVPTSAKKAAAWCLLRTGALSLHRSLFEKGRGIVLMYHRINDDRDPFFPSLPVRAFARQLDYLKRHYRIEPLDTLMEWVLEGAHGQPVVALTLDDGYPDTYDFAFPELARRGIPATLFLSTDPLESSRPLWIDRLRNAIKHARKAELVLTDLALPRFRLTGEIEKLAAARRLLATLKRKSPQVVEAAVAAVEERLEPGGAPREVLDWTRVREMARGPIQICAHTHRHYPLSQLDDAQVAFEIETSVRLIERQVGKKVTSFAYPNGEPGDYDQRSIEVLRELGIRYALTAHTDFVRPGVDPYELSRLFTTEPSLSLFAARLAGLGLRPRGAGGPLGPPAPVEIAPAWEPRAHPGARGLEK